MSEVWDQYTGKALAGSYVLGERLASGERTAVFATEAAGRGPLVAKVALADGEDSSVLLLHWAVASQLSHPNLIPIVKTGRAQPGSVPVAYVVMERADETLQSVLAERPLAESEVHELLPPLLSAMRYVHASGFSHGSIQPSNVMAVGETLKLSSDSVVRNGEQAVNASQPRYLAPEAAASGTPSPEADVWSLGMLVHYALTQRHPEVREDGTVLPADLPEPFATIVKHCLVGEPSGRWNVAQLQRAFEGGELVSEPVQAPPPVSEMPEVVVPRKTLASRAAPLPPPQTEPLRAYPRWLVPALGIATAIVLLVLVAKMRSNSNSSHPVTAPSAVSATHEPAPPPASASAPAPAAPPPSQTPRSAPAANPAPAPRRKTGAGGWYVVAATYSAKDAAEKRAREITSKWPRFRAHVFEPRVANPHHLVVIGADLTQDAAEDLRKRARAAGLPPDVYIKRFER